MRKYYSKLNTLVKQINTTVKQVNTNIPASECPNISLKEGFVPLVTSAPSVTPDRY